MTYMAFGVDSSYTKEFYYLNFADMKLATGFNLHFLSSACTAEISDSFVFIR